MASYGSLTLPFCNCLHQSDDIQNDPCPHIHTLTQTCHSRGMRGMHTPPGEWSPSIQWAELPTVEYTLRGSKCETPHPFKLTTTNPYIPPNWVKRESNPFQRPFFFNPPKSALLSMHSSVMDLEFLIALWCGTSRWGLYTDTVTFQRACPGSISTRKRWFHSRW